MVSDTLAAEYDRLTTERQIVLGEMRKLAGVSPVAVYDQKTRTFLRESNWLLATTSTTWMAGEGNV